jgi:thiosulfate oxidation carrier complex protein SoxZ
MAMTMGPRHVRGRRAAIGGAMAALAGTRAAIALPRDVDYAIQRLVGPAQVRNGHVRLDLPSHSDTGSSVPLTVGADGDVPRAIHVMVDGNPRPNVVSAWFAPDCGRAEFSTRIRLESAQTVTAVAQMRNGDAWRADQALTVNYGACANVGSGSDTEIRDFKPVSRVMVPRTAHLGDIVAIRTLISHPMETGLRLNAFNTWIPLRIIEEFECRFEGKMVFRARPYPAIATNPYFAFHDRVRGSGVYEFRWFDTDGSVYTNSAALALA